MTGAVISTVIGVFSVTSALIVAVTGAVIVAVTGAKVGAVTAASTGAIREREWKGRVRKREMKRERERESWEMFYNQSASRSLKHKRPVCSGQSRGVECSGRWQGYLFHIPLVMSVCLSAWLTQHIVSEHE